MTLSDLDRLEKAARAAAAYARGKWHQHPHWPGAVANHQNPRDDTTLIAEGGLWDRDPDGGAAVAAHIAAADPPTVLALVGLVRELVEVMRPAAAVASRYDAELHDDNPVLVGFLLGDYRRAAALLARIGATLPEPAPPPALS